MNDAPPPATTPATAAELARRHFGLGGQARALPSERDRNFRIDAEDGTCWVLKIANAAESAEWIAAENALLRRLAPTGLVPRLRSSVEGRDAVEVEPHIENGDLAPPLYLPPWMHRTNGLAGYLSFSLFVNRIRLDEVEREHLMLGA